MSEANAWRPGLALGGYPERVTDSYAASQDPVERVLAGVLPRRGERESALQAAVALIREYGEPLTRMPDDVLAMSISGLRLRLAQDGVNSDLAMQAFAMVREVAGRTLDMRHHDTQLFGGWVMFGGRLAVMQTGEGKTLTATLPACVAAMSGIPVHVVTTNDYLAARDAESMLPVYRMLGVSVGVIGEDMDMDARRAAYACDVTYCTNKQIAFDYLRDRVARGAHTSALHDKLARLYDGGSRVAPLLLRGLCYAIVDEADSVLVDEARTPLILSRPVEDGDDPTQYGEALALARALENGRHFVLDERNRSARLTDAGKSEIERRNAALGGIWTARRHREELTTKALAAEHLYLRDHHYVVHEERIQIVDDYTGRLMPDRSWGRGLQQLVEVKEGCQLSGHKETLARISYQRFFGRYLKLAGMTGTANGLAGELSRVYGLSAVEIPTFKPSRRVELPEQVFARGEDRLEAVVESARSLAAAGRAVLIGTRSVEASEAYGARLAEAGVDTRVLNARQDREEAAIVAEAGQPGRVTVATNMAGRGTDIPLRQELEDGEGLHVIVASRNEAARIDRQLIGRCARQGDPGSFQMFAALDDEVPSLVYPPSLGRAAAMLARGDGRLPAWIGRWFQNIAQRALERRHRRVRAELQRLDEQLAQTLAFSGRPE